MEEPSLYELKALKEIHNWKNPEKGWLEKTWGRFNKQFGNAADAFTSAPGVSWVVDKVVGGLVTALNDLAHWSIQPDAIYHEFKDIGHDVGSRDDIFRLDLEHVDEVIGRLALKYQSLAAVEGAATGVVGLVGIPADVVALVVMNQRAIGEYATYCGFDISTQEERLFAINVLSLASSPADPSQDAAMAHLSSLSKHVASKTAWRNLDKGLYFSIVQKLAQTLGMRLTRAKAAQIVPVVGAGVGAGFNLHYTTLVCKAGYYLYRERFLAAKYGPELIDLSGGFKDVDLDF